MFMPTLDFEDGYGFSYGVRMAALPPSEKEVASRFP